MNHSKFYEACKTKGSVEDAFAFVKIMRIYSTLKHYTMLMGVCCHARDIDGENLGYRSLFFRFTLKGGELEVE